MPLFHFSAWTTDWPTDGSTDRTVRRHSPLQAVAFTTKVITMTASATVHPNRGSDRCSSFMELLAVPDYGRFFLFDD